MTIAAAGPRVRTGRTGRAHDTIVGVSEKRPKSQRTPKGKEIPVPKKGEVLDALRKAAQPKSGMPANDGQSKGKA